MEIKGIFNSSAAFENHIANGGESIGNASSVKEDLA